jgi:hypothetical protein
MHVCLEDFQDTSALPNIKTYLLMDFVSFVTDIQFTSLYSPSTNEYLV